MTQQRWYVSPYNLTPEVKSAVPQRVIVNDVFLREGGEKVGVGLRTDALVKIARELDAAGVPQIEIMGRSEDTIRAIGGLGLKAELEVITGSTTIIDVCQESGVDRINSPQAYSDHMRPDGRSKGQVIDGAAELVRYVRERGMKAAMGPMDVTRTSVDDLKAFYQAMIDAGADRLYLWDTAGAAAPQGMKYLASQIRDAFPDVDIAIHAHNDFGLGVANAFAALEAGCNVLDTAVNGLARKTGLPPLAEVAAALEILYGINTGIKLERMYGLSKLVEDLTRIPIREDMPLVGQCAFAEFSAPPVTDESLQRTHSALSSEVVGNRSWLALNALSGPPAIKFKLNELGISLSEDKIPTMMAMIAEEQGLRSKILTDDDIRYIVRRVSES